MESRRLFLKTLFGAGVGAGITYFLPSIPLIGTETSLLPDPEALFANRVIVDMRDEILFYRPTTSPLVYLMTGLKGERRLTSKECKAAFEWLDKDGR